MNRRELLKALAVGPFVGLPYAAIATPVVRPAMMEEPIPKKHRIVLSLFRYALMPEIVWNTDDNSFRFFAEDTAWTIYRDCDHAVYGDNAFGQDVTGKEIYYQVFEDTKPAQDTWVYARYRTTQIRIVEMTTFFGPYGQGRPGTISLYDLSTGKLISKSILRGQHQESKP